MTVRQFSGWLLSLMFILLIAAGCGRGTSSTVNRNYGDRNIGSHHKHVPKWKGGKKKGFLFF